ncbi:hypothetical protein KW475_21415, partial [Vibrio fluvialis]|nr:hypothetical protein [Vibrio fluvialis]
TNDSFLHAELQFYVASFELSSLRLVRRGVQLSAGADQCWLALLNAGAWLRYPGTVLQHP